MLAVKPPGLSMRPRQRVGKISKSIALAADIAQHLQNRCSFRSKPNDLSTLLPPELEHR